MKNRMHWRKTEENPPTKEDAEKADSFVLSVYYSEFYKKWRICQQTLELVVALCSMNIRFGCRCLSCQRHSDDVQDLQRLP